MASKRQPSKQKRAAQNRNERAARAARAANAQVAAGAGSATGSGAATPGQGGSLLSRLRGGGATGSSGRGVAKVADARNRGAALRPDQVPGYRAALSAVLAAAAAVLLCIFALRYPVDAQGDLYNRETLVADWAITALDAAREQPDATPKELARSIDDWAPGRGQQTVIKALWPLSLAIFLPLIGAALGFHAVRRRASSKVVNRALYASLFGAVLTQGLLLLFLPVVIAMGVAMFQVRKAETIAAASGGVVEVGEADPLDEATEVSDVDEAIEVSEVEQVRADEVDRS